jgi:hypothetical protein
MRDRGKLTRVLLVVAAAGAAATVIARLRSRGSATPAELPTDVRSAIDQGVQAGRNSATVAPTESEWIPVSTVAAAEPDAAEDPVQDPGLAASA